MIRDWPFTLQQQRVCDADIGAVVTIRFSIVIPAWNEADYLPTCLESIAAQDYAGPIEVIVVDNNSTDAASGVARAAGALVLQEPRQGVCAARQLGTQAAQGEIVISTDADTTFAHDWLSTIDREFSTDPSLVAVTGPCHWLDAPWWGRWYERTLFATVARRHRRTGRVIYASATNIAFKKSVWTGYDTNLTQGGDELDLIRQLQESGPMQFLPENRTFTSSRRLRKGLAYNLFVTCLYHYLLAYLVNRLVGRPVLGMAPAFRCPTDVVHFAAADTNPHLSRTAVTPVTAEPGSSGG